MSEGTDAGKIVARNKRLELIRFCRSTARRMAVDLELLGDAESALNAARILQAMTLAERSMLRNDEGPHE